jgi:hypothetical protein
MVFHQEPTYQHVTWPTKLILDQGEILQVPHLTSNSRKNHGVGTCNLFLLSTCGTLI